MKIICDTHILIFWQDAPERLTVKARQAFDQAQEEKKLYCCDISFWEIAKLFSRGRLNASSGISTEQYINDLISALHLNIISITPKIAQMSQLIVTNKDPADRLIAASAIANRLPLISADKDLRQIADLTVIW